MSENNDKPFTYAYVYPSPFTGMEIIHYGTNGATVNGNTPIKAIPLYRSPTLTDEEREDLQMWISECLRQCRNATDGNDWDAAERWSGRAARAAKMLERLK
jgi:hypothetical protein